MSDSGFSGLPPSSRTADTALPQGLAELKAKLIALRGEIRAEAARQRLEGEILRRNPDGTAVIRTERGEITVALRGRDLPPEGTRVSVEIPAGPAPRTVTIREIPAQDPAPAATARTPSPPPTEVQSTPAASPAPQQRLRLDAQTTADIARRTADAPAPVPPPVTLAPDDLVRLAPIAAERAAEILRAAAQTILYTQVTALPATPQLSSAPSLYSRISPALTLPALALSALQYDLPQNLPILTQATQTPVPEAQLAQLPLAARAPVQNLVQSLLQSAPAGTTTPLTIAAPPILLREGGGLPGITAGATLRAAPVAAAIITNIAAGIPSAPTSLPAGDVSPSAGTGASTFDARITAILPPQPSHADPAKAPASTASILAAAARQETASVPGAGILQTGSAGNITAQIAGVTPQNFPLLFLPPADGQAIRFFTIPLATTGLPTGTRIELTPLPGAGALPQGAGAAAAPFVPAAFFSTFSWPAMEELNNALSQAAAQKTLLLNNLAATPTTPARLPATALFFIAALRTGDIGSWLGEKTVDALRRSGKGELLARLSRDASGLQKMAAEPVTQDWRATALPMMWDGQMHKAMLYFRHDGDDDPDAENGRRGTRFIFDLTLARMGAVQLDGLHRPGRLDLILRTIQPVGGGMQQAMRRSYHAALQEAKLAGDLSFQGQAERFVTIEMPNSGASYTA